MDLVDPEYFLVLIEAAYFIAKPEEAIHDRICDRGY
jgi:hypothetical protein